MSVHQLPRTLSRGKPTVSRRAVHDRRRGEPRKPTVSRRAVKNRGAAMTRGEPARGAVQNRGAATRHGNAGSDAVLAEMAAGR